MHRRDLFRMGGAFLVARAVGLHKVIAAPLPGGTLDPRAIPQFTAPLLVPGVMPMAGQIPLGAGQIADYYEIGLRQLVQQVLPSPFPATTVWGYGAINAPATFSAPACTIEARYNRPVRIKWINQLVDAAGRYLPHLLPLDQTLHWANPAGPPDAHGMSQHSYVGPIPMVVHLHGGHSGDESDGFPEAWFLPDAVNIPTGYARTGSDYDYFRLKAQALYSQAWTPGSAVVQYPNDQRATTLWYHDHTLGMTRANVYAGPAGFYIIRGGPQEFNGSLPGPAPRLGDAPGQTYGEIPLAIQDRSFNTDGSLFYPSNRAFFEGLAPAQLSIPFAPSPACSGAPSDISPIWNPEFFGNAIVVNGRAWPYVDVDRREYRLRLLNGCNSRFLILQFDRPLKFTMIGGDGGYFPRPVLLDRLLLAPAGRADVLVDFSQAPPGARVRLLNVGPDEPFGGGTPDHDFDRSDPETTGLVMEFRVSASRPPAPGAGVGQIAAGLPPQQPLPPAFKTRQVSLNETGSASVFIRQAPDGSITLDCGSGEAFGPAAALLGTMTNGSPGPKAWMDATTESVQAGTVEEWEIFNFTEDAHPIHLHLVQFQIVNRQRLVTDAEGMPVQPVRLAGQPMPPEPDEAGEFDTVIAYPGQVTRIRALFDKPGRYVWHCHILEHEDNEMMRPLDVT